MLEKSRASAAPCLTQIIIRTLRGSMGDGFGQTVSYRTHAYKKLYI